MEPCYNSKGWESKTEGLAGLESDEAPMPLLCSHMVQGGKAAWVSCCVKPLLESPQAYPSTRKGPSWPSLSLTIQPSHTVALSSTQELDKSQTLEFQHPINQSLSASIPWFINTACLLNVPIIPAAYTPQSPLPVRCWKVQRVANQELSLPSESSFNGNGWHHCWHGSKRVFSPAKFILAPKLCSSWVCLVWVLPIRETVH